MRHAQKNKDNMIYTEQCPCVRQDYLGLDEKGSQIYTITIGAYSQTICEEVMSAVPDNRGFIFRIAVFSQSRQLQYIVC